MFRTVTSNILLPNRAILQISHT